MIFIEEKSRPLCFKAAASGISLGRIKAEKQLHEEHEDGTKDTKERKSKTMRFFREVFFDFLRVLRASFVLFVPRF